MLTEAVLERLNLWDDRKQLVICGVESHVCVMQTVFAALDLKYEVHVVCDAVSSQRLGPSFYLNTSI